MGSLDGQSDSIPCKETRWFIRRKDPSEKTRMTQNNSACTHNVRILPHNGRRLPKSFTRDRWKPLKNLAPLLFALCVISLIFKTETSLDITQARPEPHLLASHVRLHHPRQQKGGHREAAATKHDRRLFYVHASSLGMLLPLYPSCSRTRIHPPLTSSCRTPNAPESPARPLNTEAVQLACYMTNHRTQLPFLMTSRYEGPAGRAGSNPHDTPEHTRQEERRESCPRPQLKSHDNSKRTRPPPRRILLPQHHVR